MPELVWITSDILEWDAYCASATYHRFEWRRPHEALESAEELLLGISDRERRANCISALRRALNIRKTQLEDRYAISSQRLPGNPVRFLERLEVLGIARRLLIENLLAIRNDVEYRDAEPPPPERCRELVDSVWYYLRSTDDLVRHVPDTLQLDHFDESGRGTPYSLTLDLEYSGGLQCKAHGWLAEAMFSREPKPGWLEMSVSDMHSPERWRDMEVHEDKIDSDRWVAGAIQMTPGLTLHLLREVVGSTLEE